MITLMIMLMKTLQITFSSLYYALVERLSMTFTANGKRQKSNFWSLILAVCTI